MTSPLNSYLDEPSRRFAVLGIWLSLWLGLCLPAFAQEEPTEAFFAPLAERLLRQQFPFGVTNIPIAPTNQYSPAVHRLLQVTANIHEATRTNRFPCVFRPLFRSEAGGVILCGFTNDSRRSTLDAYLATHGQHGIPFVIGARKGFPNFNEFTLRTDLQVMRKLELRRPDANSLPTETNQMYVVGISNLFGLEAWNSYSTPYPGELTLEVRCVAFMSVTNRAGLNFNVVPIALPYGPVTLPAGFWEGRRFLVPLLTNVALLPPAAYRFVTQTFEPLGMTNFAPDRGIGFPLPEWTLTLSNRVGFFLSEGDQLVDAVWFHDLSASADIGRDLLSPWPALGPLGWPEDDIMAALWDTNRLSHSLDIRTPTHGVIRQLLVSLGMESVSDGVWRSYNGLQSGADREHSIDVFRIFCGLTPLFNMTNPPVIGSRVLAMQAPFAPWRRVVRTTTWQANDPLVHSHVGDLLPCPANAMSEAVVPPQTMVLTNSFLASLGSLNWRFAPWGGNWLWADPAWPAPSDFDPAIKDPGVWSSDDWSFPVGQPLSLGWIGRVHRGTPWQTVYLKSDVATDEAWREQSNDFLWHPPSVPPSRRFARTHPTNDWFLAALLATRWNTNPPQPLVSINSSSREAWGCVWDGLLVLSNNLPDAVLAGTFPDVTPQFASLVMAGDSPQAATLTEAVRQTRAGRRGGFFRDVGELVAIPGLSVASPWLNSTTSLQRNGGLTDEALEAIPSQILTRLRPDPYAELGREDGVVTLRFWIGEADDFEVQVSADLELWGAYDGTVEQGPGWVQITNEIGTSAAACFFRVKLGP